MRFSRRFLIDIDALFDTRIGWVKAIKPERLEIMDYDVYRRRFTEEWATVLGFENWEEEYQKRDKRALMNAEPTELLLTMKNEFECMLLEIEMHSPIEKPTLTINTWPYTDLTDQEMQTFLQMFRIYYDMVQVELVSWPLSELTPGRLATAWDCWIMYDWFAWIELNAKHLKKPIPSFTITHPALLTPELTKETVEQLKRDGVNPFKEHIRFMAEWVGVDPRDSALFSLARPKKDAQTPQS